MIESGNLHVMLFLADLSRRGRLILMGGQVGIPRVDLDRFVSVNIHYVHCLCAYINDVSTCGSGHMLFWNGSHENWGMFKRKVQVVPADVSCRAVTARHLPKRWSS